MELNINKDISKYRMTFKGYTPRAIVCTALILCICVAIALGLYDYLLLESQLVLIIVTCFPIALFYLDDVPAYSLPTEKIIRLILLYIFSPKKSIVDGSDMLKPRKKDSFIVSFLSKRKFNVPRSVQDFIPLETFYENGMASVGNRYSVVYEFSDVDYSVLSDGDKSITLSKYEQIIASFTDNSTYKISVITHNCSQEEVYDKMALPDFEPNQKLADSINEQIFDCISSNNQTVTRLYLTVTSFQRTKEDAAAYFETLTNNLYGKFSSIGSMCMRLNLRDRISLYHFLNNQNNGQVFNYNSVKDIKGGDIKNYCCPEMWHLHQDYIDTGSCLYRSFYLQNLGTSLDDKFFRTILNNIPELSCVSIEMKSLTTSEAQNKVNRAVANAETKLSKYRKSKTKTGDITSYAPPELIEESRACTGLYEDINEHDQRLFFATILVTITAKDKKTLDTYTKIFTQQASEKAVTFNILHHQQSQGLFSCLPYGINNPIEVNRLFTTYSIAAFVPISAQVVRSYGPKALWEGRNPITKKVNSINRDNLPNGNGLIFGDSGSGKSVQAKTDICQRRIKEPESDIIILDPKGEYSILANALGGIAVDISVSSPDHINLMEISEKYGAINDSNNSPIKAKVSFLQSVVQIMSEGEITKTALNSIIDRCATRLYKRYMSGTTKEQPTLKDLYNELLTEKKDVEQAKQIALAIETYAAGSLDVFSQQTNIGDDHGFIVFDMHRLDDSFKTLGLMIMLDQVINRVARNRAQGIYTYVYIDEFHKFLNTEAETLVMDLWKMGRAMHCFSTGITQNIVEVLNSTNGQLIAHNSEYLKILKCGRMEIVEDLSRVLFIPQQLLTYISGIAVGNEKLRRSTGLIKYGTTIIPFESEIPHDSYLYSIINSD